MHADLLGHDLSGALTATPPHLLAATNRSQPRIVSETTNALAPSPTRTAPVPQPTFPERLPRIHAMMPTMANGSDWWPPHFPTG